MTVELQEEKGGSQTSANLSCNFLVALRFHGQFDIWGVDFELLKYGEEEKSKIKDKEQISASPPALIAYGTL